MNKQNVINSLNELPKEFQLDDLIERLIVIEKIDKGLAEMEEGKTISHKQAKKEVSKWLK